MMAGNLSHKEIINRHENNANIKNQNLNVQVK